MHCFLIKWFLITDKDITFVVQLFECKFDQYLSLADKSINYLFHIFHLISSKINLYFPNASMLHMQSNLTSYKTVLQNVQINN